MNKKKILFSIIFFLVIFGITIYTIFSQNNVTDILKSIVAMNWIYILLGIILIILYFLMQGIYMKIMLKTLDVEILLISGMFYSIVEFFFSGITPSSTGGQPVQLFYMTKDKIPTEKSLIVLILNAIFFKLFLVVFGFIIMICNFKLIFKNGLYIGLLFVLGMIVDIIVIIVCYLLMYNKMLIKKIIELYYKCVNKIIHKEVNYEEKIKNILAKYSNNAKFIKNHSREVFIGMIITFLQRIFMFSITYIVYRGLGLNEISYFELLLLQIFTQIAIEGLPLPGGTGALEFVTKKLYISILGELSIIGTVLTRTLSFYLPLIITMMIILVITKIIYLNQKEGE